MDNIKDRLLKDVIKTEDKLLRDYIYHEYGITDPDEINTDRLVELLNKHNVQRLVNSTLCTITYKDDSGVFLEIKIKKDLQSKIDVVYHYRN